MRDAPASPHIFISAAEPSADLHGSALIDAVRGLCPDARFTGVAGPRMRRSGCNSIYDMTKHSSMLTAALGQAHHAYQMLAEARRTLNHTHFDASVVIDAPTLNLPVASRAGKRGVPSLYYIAPQTWAWGEKPRIRRLRSAVDRVACIWPFEERYFRSHGLDADYVGHPLFARLKARQVDRERVDRLRQGGTPVLVIMPGSRRQEIEENFCHQLRVAATVRGRFPKLKVLVSVANARVKRLLQAKLMGAGAPIEMHERCNSELLEAADLALVVSGTIALETAFHHKPMIVMYNSSRWLYHLCRWAIQTPYFSMPNILANREIVPEFMPYYRSSDPIAAKAVELLTSEESRRRVSCELERLVQPFIDSRASDNTARIVLEMAGAPADPRPLRTFREAAAGQPIPPTAPRPVPATNGQPTAS